MRPPAAARVWIATGSPLSKSMRIAASICRRAASTLLTLIFVMSFASVVGLRSWSGPAVLVVSSQLLGKLAQQHRLGGEGVLRRVQRVPNKPGEASGAPRR